MRRLAILCWFLVACLPARAQETTQTEDDRGFLTGFLEEKLSGIGRAVTIEGFRGALSSRATFTKLSIADDSGVWITFGNGALSWNRAALLSGRIEIAELSADEIQLLRKPVSDKPSAEFAGFSLPELPVSVTIGQLRADRLILAPTILGEEAVVSISGKADLAGGTGSTEFAMTRVDGKKGALTFSGAYANATGQATLDLLASEGPEGIAASLLNLPGRPAAELALHGSGSLADFRTDLAISTDGQPRVRGQLVTTAPQTKDDPGDRSFALALRGDISSLLAPEFRAFFGAAVTLEADGARRANGQIDLTRMVLDSAGAEISGRLSLSREYAPLAAALTVRLGLPDGQPLVLPMAGGQTTARNGVLKLRYDSRASDDWSLNGNLGDLSRPDFRIGKLTLDGKGRVLGLGSGSARIVGATSFGASDIELSDAALAQATGSELTGSTIFSWQQGSQLRLRQIEARTGDMALGGDLMLDIRGLDLGVDGLLSLTVGDMARFSTLAGRPLGGGAEIRLSGNGLVREATFDVDVTATGQNLTIGQTLADRALAGRSTIRATVARDRLGLVTLSAGSLHMKALTAAAEGSIGPKDTDLSARMNLADLGMFDPAFSGALSAEARLEGTTGERAFALTGSATDMAFGMPTLDMLLRGETRIGLSAREAAAAFVLEEATVENPAISAGLAKTHDSTVYRIGGEIRDTARILPGFPGPTQIEGSVGLGSSDYRLNLAAAGPGGIAGDVRGTVARDLSRADLALSGTGQIAILNNRIAPRSVDGPIRFDLGMNGPLDPTSLSGRVSGTGLRFASPAENLSLENLDLTGDVGGGSLRLSGRADIRGGGSADLSGTVGLSPPFDSSLSANLRGVHLSNPGLFQTDLDGMVSFDGSLLEGGTIGGTVTIARSEITLSSAAFGPAALPPVKHVNDSAEARATRRRSGVGQTGMSGTDGTIHGLDLVVNAPARLFVRGLGLDAELGGSVHLRGTTANVEPTGQFKLIRGRLSLLGKRFNLDEGIVQLFGSMVPYVRFTALADSFGATITILLEGPADKPEIHFTSSTDVPEEEVLSRLLFGRGLNQVSAFQLAQLANAIATLTGSGGDGVIARLRKSVGLDDLDITADEDGNAALKAGKYLSDQLYGEVSVGVDGKSRIDLNLDLNADLTLHGTIGTDGQTGAGVLFSKDY